MSESSFTIEFPEHVDDSRKQYIVNRLSEDHGVLVNPRTKNIFEISCHKPNQVEKVGWSLFHTHFKSYCNVVDTSGTAEARAGAYSAPQRKRHLK